MPIVRELITVLGYRVEEAKIRRAERLVANYARTQNRATAATNRAGFAAGRFSARLLGLATAALGVRAAITELTEYERLQGILVTLTGSTEDAARAFELIDTVARQSPNNIDQVTEAFIRMMAVGVQPSMRTLLALSNIAAAMGTDVQQIANSITGLTAGLTRQLEHTLRSQAALKDQGRTLEIIIRGQLYRVANTQEELFRFFTMIGETQFAGGVEEQMARLPGLFSNALDSVKRFVRQFGEGGFTDALKEFLEVFIGTAEEGQSIAQMLGTMAGGVLRAFTQVLRFAKEHADGFRIALTGLILAGTSSLALRFWNSLRLLGGFFRGGGGTVNLVTSAAGGGAGGGALAGGLAAGGLAASAFGRLLIGLGTASGVLLAESLGRGLMDPNAESAVFDFLEDFRNNEDLLGDIARVFIGMRENSDLLEQSFEDFYQSLNRHFSGAEGFWDNFVGFFTYLGSRAVDAVTTTEQERREQAAARGLSLEEYDRRRALGEQRAAAYSRNPIARVFGGGVDILEEDEQRRLLRRGQGVMSAIQELGSFQAGMDLFLSRERTAVQKGILGRQVLPPSARVVTQDVVVKFENTVNFTGDPEATQSRREMVQELADFAILPEVERMVSFVRGTGGVGGD